MLIIEEYDEILRTREDHSGKVNYEVLMSYSDLRRTKNELLDFDRNIWERNMDAVVAEIRRIGLKEFTISYAGTRLLEMLADFEKRVIRVAGFRNIKTGHKDWETDEDETKPAILMKVE